MRSKYVDLLLALDEVENDMVTIKKRFADVWSGIREEDEDFISESLGLIVEFAYYLEKDAQKVGYAATGMKMEILKDDNSRRCDVCGKRMTFGYVIDDCEYYCSDDCLHKKYTPQEYEEMYKNDVAYWTEWEDD